MTNDNPALVTPEILEWCRIRSAFGIVGVANKLGIDLALVARWEIGAGKPTVDQARELAKLYDVPFALFYLPDVATAKLTMDEEEGRAEMTIKVYCKAPDEVFDENMTHDEMPDDIEAALESMGGLPCDGGGIPGLWCGQCPWGDYEELGGDET